MLTGVLELTDACETLVASQETSNTVRKWEPFMELQKADETLGQKCLTEICCCSLWFFLLFMLTTSTFRSLLDIPQVLFYYYPVPLIVPAEVVFLDYSSPRGGDEYI